MNYYNEFDPYAAQWLRNLIAAGHIPRGEVDERSIVEVQPADLTGFRQCHFFAGIGGWALAARLAGFPEDRELWTGSAPCQPFSVAGKGKAQADNRHLWPHFFRLIEARRPAILMGEQVAAAVGKDWLDGVAADLEGIGYACGSVVVPACAVDAPHRRDRLWFVAHAAGEGRGQTRLPSAGDLSTDGDWPGNRAGDAGQTGNGTRDVAHAHGLCRQVDQDAGGCAHGSGAREVAGSGGASDGAVADAAHRHDGIRVAGAGERSEFESRGGHVQGAVAYTPVSPDQRSQPQSSFWSVPTLDGSGNAWIIGHDGKARRVEPSIRLLAHGVPARVGRLRAYGNAIVPQVAAEVIGAYLDTEAVL